MIGAVNWVILGPAGVVVRAGRTMHEPPGALVVDFMPAAALSLMWTGAAWEARPELPAEVIAGDTLTLSGCPDATSAEVFDMSGSEIMGSVTAADGVLTLTLPDAGRYQIEITPPLPWLPRTLAMEVS